MKSFVTELSKKGITTAIFDLDGTLAQTDITKLFFFLRRREMLNTIQWKIWKAYIYIFWWPIFFVLDSISRPLFQRIFYRWYRRFSLQDLVEGSEAYFDKIGRFKLLEPTTKLLQEMIDAGFIVEIHSSNIEPFVRPFAEHLDIPFRAISVEEKNNYAIIHTKKIEAFKKNALERTYVNSCTLIADSKHDLPEFERVAVPIIYSHQRPSWGQHLNGYWIRPSGSIEKL